MSNLTVPIVTLEPDTWVIADTHFAHTNIRIYCDRPDDCDERMFSAWERLVAPNDNVLHLGDLILAGKESECYRRVKTLSGRKHLIRGNHDRHGKPWYGNLGFAVLARRFMAYIEDYGWVVFSHEPQMPFQMEEFCTESVTPTINVHGHIHNHGYAHARYRSGVQYKNASVEVWDYQPVRLATLLDREFIPRANTPEEQRGYEAYLANERTHS